MMEGDLLTWMKGLGIMAFIAVIIVWDAKIERSARRTREKEQSNNDNQTQ